MVDVFSGLAAAEGEESVLEANGKQRDQGWCTWLLV